MQSSVPSITLTGIARSRPGATCAGTLAALSDDAPTLQVSPSAAIANPFSTATPRGTAVLPISKRTGAPDEASSSRNESEEIGTRETIHTSKTPVIAGVGVDITTSEVCSHGATSASIEALGPSPLPAAVTKAPASRHTPVPSSTPSPTATCTSSCGADSSAVGCSVAARSPLYRPRTFPLKPASKTVRLASSASPRMPPI
mmetsp:Transcript_7242/g.21876  ORF Transcript_7242/g.21876 Transcript_7242/m.21876 type:complete len:201 (-) Transcript_7242:189-791(-)